MESFRIPEDSSIPRMSTYNRKRTCGEIGMGRGERRSQGKSWSPGCLQGAASSGPVVPLRTSLRLKCLGTLRAPLRTLLKHQSAVCAHTPPPPGSTLLPLLKGELRLHAPLRLRTGPALSPRCSKRSSASRSVLSSLFCSSSPWTRLQLHWSK